MLTTLIEPTQGQLTGGDLPRLTHLGEQRGGRFLRLSFPSNKRLSRPLAAKVLPMNLTAWLHAASLRRFVFGFAFLCLIAGCGAPMGEVNGKVTYKDKPLPYGNVSLLASDGTNLSAEIQADGTYKI